MSAALATFVIAHAGHWASGLIYFAPVAIVVAALGWQSYKDKRNPDHDHAIDRGPE